MAADSLDRGAKEGSLPAAAEREVVVERFRRYTSTGYIRNQLLVLEGGGGGGGGKIASEAVASNGLGLANGSARKAAVVVDPGISQQMDTQLEQVREARMKGYEGDSCGECGNFTLVRNGTCLKCVTCGSTSGCS